MSEDTLLVFDELTLQKYKEKWDRYTIRCNTAKLKIPYEEMLGYFKHRVSLQVIAKQFEVTRELIRQLYNLYFKELLSSVSGKERYSSLRKSIKQEKTEAEEKSFFAKKPYSTLVEEATKHGLEVRAITSCISSSNEVKFVKQRVTISGSFCAFRTSDSVFLPRGSRSGYVRFMIGKTKKPYDFAVLHQAVKGYPEKIFIIPGQIITDMLEKCIIASIYIPIEKRPAYRNIFPQNDWWKYENAWHLIAEANK